jgi:hypothetical protein
MRTLVGCTWHLSRRSLRAAGLRGVDPMLRLLSCFEPGVPVPVALLDAPIAREILGRRSTSPVELLRALASVSLIETYLISPDDATWAASVHPLVAFVTCSEAAEEARRPRRWFRRFGPPQTDCQAMSVAAAQLLSRFMRAIDLRYNHHRMSVALIWTDDRQPAAVLQPVDRRPPDDSYGEEGPVRNGPPSVPVVRRLLAAHIVGLLNRSEVERLPDAAVAHLINALARCLPDFIVAGADAPFQEILHLVTSRLARWGPDPVMAAVEMNMRYGYADEELIGMPARIV